ncbi:MAG: Fic family protein [Gemmatimonadetes bacterium]|nr:Fic family protein [Gemmatimonadota bacterium]
MHSLADSYLDGLRLTADHASTLGALREFRGKQELFRKQTPDVLSGLLERAIVESAESSNRLEGVTAPRDRVEAVVKKPTAAANRSEQEIAGYRDALVLIHEAHGDMHFSINVVLQLHQLLYRYLPTPGGRWKSTQNEIVERTPDGSLHRIRFTPVAPVSTPGAMEQLVERYARALDRNREPLVLVPLAVLDFLCIHPFSDGNGRMARLLTLLLLYHFQYEVGRYISLERIFEESKESYYETLEASSVGWHQGRHDVIPWITYFWGVVLAAYKEFEARVGTIRAGRGAKTDLVEQAVARRTRAFGIADIEAECPGVSREMVRRVLRGLRNAGQLQQLGRGPGAKWVPVKA